ncbi:MAG: YdiU family protein [Magnetococcales bacterium]|nr:YdiU family protein [Magnetococcales bacterium]NGZ06098.1 YdiU family protein [Magnetococcales bacterium]
MDNSGSAWRFDNSYQRLPEHFFARLAPVPVPEGRLVVFNRPLAMELGWDVAAMEPYAAGIFSGNHVPRGAAPIAMAYAGHQFGQFVPTLGDGRAILLGELLDCQGVRRDLQLKGSGRTPFSRQGDGRAWLAPMLREYLVSEAMHALGIPTTRSLAVVTTGEPVWREAGALPGAVLTRVATSHVRVGTFQYFAARGDHEAVRILADYVVQRHFPELLESPAPYLDLVRMVCARQARLIAQWMGVGFVHGVMNTDNMAICGETIDFGPCAFLDRYDPDTVFSSIDAWGRYAFGNQPRIAAWNLARLAETLLPLIDPDPRQAVAWVTEIIQDFPERFEALWLDGMRAKMGLETREEQDLLLIEEWLQWLHSGQADYTLSFRLLGQAVGVGADAAELRALFADPAGLDQWLVRWRARLARDGHRSDAERQARMHAVNPVYIPRNHLVEEVLDRAVEQGDLQPFMRLYELLQRPYVEQPGMERYAAAPPAGREGYQTFCGT